MLSVSLRDHTLILYLIPLTGSQVAFRTRQLDRDADGRLLTSVASRDSYVFGARACSDVMVKLAHTPVETDERQYLMVFGSDENMRSKLYRGRAMEQKFNVPSPGIVNCTEFR